MKKKTKKTDDVDCRGAATIQDPLAAATALLAELTCECDRALARVNRAEGDAALNKALLDAGEAFRRRHGFANDLARITGKHVFVQRWDMGQRLNDFQRRRWLGLRRGGQMPIAAELGRRAWHWFRTRFFLQRCPRRMN